MDFIVEIFILFIIVMLIILFALGLAIINLQNKEEKKIIAEMQKKIKENRRIK